MGSFCRNPILRLLGCSERYTPPEGDESADWRLHYARSVSRVLL